MSTQTLTDTLTDTQVLPDGGETDRGAEVFHYVRKAKVAESAVMGNLVIALCGETFPVTRSPKPNSPVCDECKRIYQSLPPGGE